MTYVPVYEPFLILEKCSNVYRYIGKIAVDISWYRYWVCNVSKIRYINGQRFFAIANVF